MIVSKSIESYLARLEVRSPPIVREMEVLAARRDFPIVGPQVGRLLKLLAAAIGARRILELGSGFGYSAAWFAQALPAAGEVHLIDGDAENLTLARRFLTRARLGGRARFHQGDARAVMATLRGPFDIVFNDIDKEQYPEVIEPAVALLRPGGLFITDNALWKGQVTRRRGADRATRAVQAFNRRLLAHPHLEAVILPLRDGVALAMKKARALGKNH